MGYGFPLDKSPELVKTEQIVTSHCCDIEGRGREE